ncbi:MAG: choice-of-anchor tandem repeat GloVer-containing protein [Syntrophobacteraceae bacterium]
MRLTIINPFTFEVMLSIFIVSCLGACRGGTERKEIGTEHCLKRSNPARVFKIGFMLCLLYLTCAQPGEALAQFSVLRSFGTSAEDGAAPVGFLALSGSTLYGMTVSGGAHGYGTIFRIETDGRGYKLLHSFEGGPGDGATPLEGRLVPSGQTLYGAAYDGGAYNTGAIFRADTDGMGYRLLHSLKPGNLLSLIFKSFENQGKSPCGVMALSGSTLYGTAEEWGPHNMGVIFRIDTDGGGYQLLHSFGSVPNDGMAPHDLILQGSTLYGVTAMGGSHHHFGPAGNGTLFRIDTDGADYRILHNFGSVTDDGMSPNGLILSGSTLYGTTGLGGDFRFGYGAGLPCEPQGNGAIFRVDTDGGGYRVLHRLREGTGDGFQPAGSLILSGSTLYGMTVSGGANNGGAIFRIKTGGSEYQLIHSFDHGTGPSGSLTLVGTKLYGTTVKGGAYDSGAIFSFDVGSLEQACPSHQSE